ncbi:type ISP restriction/modification enzyme [Ruminococcus sp.]|uniref:type ISP restriction/modification enzyme n=1 Tax=Ruminococcus sp. TaxID=41978 RepID=UPI0025DFBBC3|nr:type ISP restriction/modification enzyme [Ruminococcus sp.]
MTKADLILKDFNRQTGGGREDPVIHFYEEFLTAYDKAQKVQRGVYYTPQPVVNFIVRAVDSILKTEFGLADGLASEETKTVKYMREKIRGQGMTEDTKEVPKVQILDPATGTGTFLRQTILQIYDNFRAKHKGESEEQIKKAWNEYVPKHLLPRLNGFELMMAPYAVAHMKLAMVLKDTGYDFGGDHRLNVFLTNSLEEAGKDDFQMTLFDNDPLAFESIEANQAKKNNGINVIIGNPPYSGISSNNNEFISNLINDYKYIDGVYFNERKHWLNDDYVKFIRLCEKIISEHCDGILAFINNHAFLDNPTFRCMRHHLLETFDIIYIVDLHGNVMRKEIAPNGERDENVFDIMQGVSINIFVKKTNSKKNCTDVFHSDMYGTRNTKYNNLNNCSVSYMQIEPVEPYFFFVPKDISNSDTYSSGFSLSDLFLQNVTGVVSARDDLVINASYDTLLDRIKRFSDLSISDSIVREEFFGNRSSQKYLPGDTRGWKLSTARKQIADFKHDDMIQKIDYRPFDTRFIYYSNLMVDWGRENIFYNMLKPNIALVIPRQAVTDNWSHVSVSTCLVDNRFHYSNKGIPIVCPLYLYDTDFGKEIKRPNLKTDIVHIIEEKLGLQFSEQWCDKAVFTPVDLLDYIYAVLHSPQYREKYKEFLKIDFPRVPYPTDQDTFWKLVEIGGKLRECHLMQTEFDTAAYSFIGAGTNEVVKPEYKNGRVYISKTQYFDNVPQAQWEQYIGGYQPLQKWLKDRKKTMLSAENIEHYKKIIAALKLTEELMAEIDQVVEF